MDILGKIEEYNKEIKIIINEFINKQNEFWSFIQENKKEVRNILPKVGVVYHIENFHSSEWSGIINIKEIDVNALYFKVTDNRLLREHQFERYGVNEGLFDLKVKGIILDCNYKEISSFNDYIKCSSLREITYKNAPKKEYNKPTNLYVMIDKNTGYYKIGRSIDPIKREKTLQSEKPTIELIKYYSGKIKHEKDLHLMFRDKRIRGEWFDLSGSDIKEIDNFFNKINKYETSII